MSFGLTLADFLNGLRLRTSRERREKTVIIERMVDSDCLSFVCVDVMTVIHLMEYHGFCLQL